MKKLAFLVLPLAMLLLQNCTSPSIALELGPAVPKEQFGFNTGTSFYWCNPDNIAACIQEYNQLAPNIIRFPGGVDANYYHLDGQGYGFRQDPGKGTPGVNAKDSDGDGTPEEEPKDTTKLSTTKRAGDFKDPKDLQYYPSGGNVIGPLIQLVSASKSQVLFTCNMYDASYEDNKRVLDSLLRGGCQLAGIELGNEFYLNKYMNTKYETVAEYIDTAKYYTTRLRKDFPKVKIGIVAAPSHHKHLPRSEEFLDWNQSIAKADFYDAYIIHDYGKDKTVNCDSKPHEFQAYQKVLQNQLDSFFRLRLPEYQALFPKKQLWLTEWNTTNIFKCYGQSQLGNLFFAQYQCELAANHARQVPIAVHHNWLGRGSFYAMLSPKEGSKDEFIEKSSSQLFKLLRPIFERETRSVALPANWPGTMPQGIVAYAFFQEAANGSPARLLLVGINNKAKAASLHIAQQKIKIGGKVKRLNGGTDTVLYGDFLNSTFENTALGDGGNGHGAIHQSSGKINGKMEIPGYGICMAVFELK